MVPNVVLVFTTLAIFSSVGIVSSQDELEHGLATDCNLKSVNRQSLFQKFSKFIDKVCCFLDDICGDGCVIQYSGKKCECGDTTFGDLDYKYCCIQMNETCKVQGMFRKVK